MLADSSFLYKHNAIMANSERGVRKKGSLFIWLFDICGLQFGIVREAFLPLGFGSGIWWFALSWCVVTFGFDLWLSLWFVCNSYLVFVNLWFFGLYLVIWFCICERKLFECIWDLDLWECLYTNFYYPKFVTVKFVHCRPWM